MTKIAMIGAGSTVFMKNLVGDILSEPLLKECEIALMDIDPKRLATSKAGGRAHRRGRRRAGRRSAPRPIAAARWRMPTTSC